MDSAKENHQKLRISRNLNKKYKKYSKEIQIIKKRNKGKIPELGTHDGNLYHRYAQAMKAVENIAKQQKTKLKPIKKF